MKVCFSSKYEKLTFMSQLKLLANSPYANLRISDDVPKSLKTQFVLVDSAAFQIRQTQKGTQTRTPIRNLQYQLEIKKPNETKYTKMEIISNESEMEIISNQSETQNPNQIEPQNSQNGDQNPAKRQRAEN